jgi:hypothetical protein
MKNAMIIIVLAAFVHTGQSQNSNTDYKFGLKLYNNITFEDKNYNDDKLTGTQYYYKYSTTDSRFLHPAIAFQWKTKKNNFNEIELTDLRIGKTGKITEIRNDSLNSSQIVDGANVTDMTFSVRYEYIRTFCRSKDRKLVPSLGFSVNPYYTFVKTSPKVTDLFPSSSQYCGLKMYVTPRLTYFFSQKFFADLNTPLMLGNCYYRKSINDDPALPVDQRNSSSIDFTELKNIFSLRIGIGIKI